MHEIKFSKIKLGLGGLSTGALAILCGHFAYLEGGFALWFCALLFGTASSAWLALATDKRPAIAFDARGITLHKLFGKGHFAWSEVHDISVSSFTMRHWGLFPVAKVTYLSITVDGDILDTKRYRYTKGSLTLPSGGIVALCAQLQAVRLAMVGEVGVAMKGAGAAGWGIDNRPGFVASPPVAGVQADRFRRLGLPTGETPEPVPAQPARPTFGRKTG